jgi:hypothetical protein
MNFLFLRADNIGCIDNAAANMDCSSLPSNLTKVIWDQGGTGWLEYAGVPKMRVPYNDPSQFQPQLNTLLTVLTTASPPLTLSQAQAVKNALIDALYKMKRINPITVSGLSIGAGTWDGSEEAMMTMTQEMTVSAASYNSSTTGLASQINTMIAGVNADIATTKSNFNAATLDHTLGYYVWDTKPDLPANAPYSNVTGIASGVSGGPFPWLPYNGTSTVNLTINDLMTIVGAYVTRRRSVASTRATKKAAVNALSTVASVIAYDVTAGWAY